MTSIFPRRQILQAGLAGAASELGQGCGGNGRAPLRGPLHEVLQRQAERGRRRTARQLTGQ